MKSAVQSEAMEQTTWVGEYLEFYASKIVTFFSFEVRPKTSIYLIGSLLSYLVCLLS